MLVGFIWVHVLSDQPESSFTYRELVVLLEVVGTKGADALFGDVFDDLGIIAGRARFDILRIAVPGYPGVGIFMAGCGS